MTESPIEPAIDPAAIEKLRELGGNPFILQMLDIFTTYVPGKVHEIETAVLSGDLEAIRAAAHPLKSSASNIGATTLRTLATRAEIAAETGRHDELSSIAAALVTELARVTTALAQVRSTLTA